MQPNEANTEHCQICGQTLDYFSMGREMTCQICHKVELGNICCSQGHYICDDCHGKGLFEFLVREIETASETSPFAIAERLMKYDQVPMLGCENAWIAAGALLASLKNQGTLQITNQHISEALQRTKKQALGGYCGLTGICGVVPAIGASFSVILRAACPKDEETAKTMRVVGKVVNAIADVTGPCCCKAFVRVGLAEAVTAAREYFDISLEASAPSSCEYIPRHPHGCRQNKCPYIEK